MSIVSISFSPTGAPRPDQTIPVDVTFTQDNGESNTVPALLPTGERGYRGTQWYVGGNPNSAGFTIPSAMVEGDDYLDATTANMYKFTNGKLVFIDQLIAKSMHMVDDIKTSLDGNTITTTFYYADGTTSSVDYAVGDIVNQMNPNLPASNPVISLINKTVNDTSSSLNDRIDQLANALTSGNEELAEAVRELVQKNVKSDNDFTEVTGLIKQEISDRKNAISGITDTLNQEISDRKSGEQTLTTNLSTETSAREAGDQVLSDKITALDDSVNKTITEQINTLQTNVTNTIQPEVNSNTAAIKQEVSDRQNAITSEQTARQTGDNNLQSQITQEVSDRKAAVSGLSDSLNNRVNDLVTNQIDGIDKTIADETTAREQGDTALQNSLNTEVQARQALDSRVDSEVNRAVASESQLQKNIDAITGSAVTGPANSKGVSAKTLTVNAPDNVTVGDSSGTTTQLATATNLSDEANARTQGDQALTQSITKESTDRQSADQSLQTSINDEAAARQSGDQTLQSDLTTESNRAQTAEKALQSSVDGLNKSTVSNVPDQGGTASQSLSFDSSDNVIIKDVNGNKTQLAKETDLANEASARQSADQTNASAIDKEISDRQTADDKLQSNITDATQSLQTSIQSEATARSQADTVLQNAVNSETTRATNAESDIKSDLQTLSNKSVVSTPVAQGDVKVDNIYRKNGTDVTAVDDSGTTVTLVSSDELATETSSREEADQALSSQISSVNSTLTSQLNTDNAANQSAISKEVSDRQDAISAEAKSRNDGDTALGNQITQEVSDRKSAVSDLQNTLNNNISQEAQARQSADTTLTNALNTEVQNRQSDTANVNSKISDEATARQNADATNSKAIEDINTALTQETTDRKSADSTLQSNLDAEAENRASGDQALQSALLTETTERDKGDADNAKSISDLQNGLSTETRSRESADTVLGKMVVQEVSDRKAGETTINKAISDETSAREAGDTALQKNIDSANASISSETTRAEGAEQALQKSISDETTRAEGVEQSHSTAISALQSTVIVGTPDDSKGTAIKSFFKDDSGNLVAKDADGNEVSLDTEASLEAEVQSRKDADATLQKNLDTEVSRAQAAEQTNSTAISTETQNRETADQELSKLFEDRYDELKLSINTNNTAQQTALNAAVSSEAQTRFQNDQTLQSNIDNEAARAKAAEQALTASLNTESSAREQFASDMESKYTSAVQAVQADYFPIQTGTNTYKLTGNNFLEFNYPSVVFDNTAVSNGNISDAPSATSNTLSTTAWVDKYYGTRKDLESVKENYLNLSTGGTVTGGVNIQGLGTYNQFTYGGRITSLVTGVSAFTYFQTQLINGQQIAATVGAQDMQGVYHSWFFNASDGTITNSDGKSFAFTSDYLPLNGNANNYKLSGTGNLSLNYGSVTFNNSVPTVTTSLPDVPGSVGSNVATTAWIDKYYIPRSTALNIKYIGIDNTLNNTSVGNNTVVTNSGNTTIGSGSKATGTNCTSIGLNAFSTGYSSTALGNTVSATGKYSVSIGAFSTTSEDNVVSVGSGLTNSADPNAPLYRRITNVADGKNPNDAVNIEQLNAAAMNAASPVGSITAFACSGTIPNYILCDGSTFDPVAYPDLYKALGTNRVPDLRGMFLRGLDTTGTIDNVQGGRKLLSFEDGSYIQGDRVGYTRTLNQISSISGNVNWTDSTKPYTSSMASLGWDVPVNFGPPWPPTSYGGSSQEYRIGTALDANGNIIYTTSSQVNGITRPKNIAVNYYIRALPPTSGTIATSGSGGTSTGNSATKDWVESYFTSVTDFNNLKSEVASGTGGGGSSLPLTSTTNQTVSGGNEDTLTFSGYKNIEVSSPTNFDTAPTVSGTPQDKPGSTSNSVSTTNWVDENYISKGTIANTGNPVGTIVSYAGANIPESYLECDGGTFDPIVYPDLYKLLGKNTTPDLRGMFLRGLDTTGNVDPQGPTRGLLSFEEGTATWGIIGQAVRGVNGCWNNSDGPYNALTMANNMGYDINGTLNPWETWKSDSNGIDRYSSDTQSISLGYSRPKNIAVNYIIKAKPLANGKDGDFLPLNMNKDYNITTNGHTLTVDNLVVTNSLTAPSSGSELVGPPIPWPTLTPPSGYLVMDGGSFDTTKYPKLAAVYTSGKLPDLRGMFIRGYDPTGNVDPNGATRGIISTEQGTNTFTPAGPGGGWPFSSLFSAGWGDGNVDYAPANAQPSGGVYATMMATGNTYNVTPYTSSTKLQNGSWGATRPTNVNFYYIVKAG